MHTHISEMMEGVDAVGELLDDVCIGTFLGANIRESSTSQGLTIDDHEQTNSFYQLCKDGL
jgi:hypothetical protein